MAQAVGFQGLLPFADDGGAAFADPVPVSHGEERPSAFQANPGSSFKFWKSYLASGHVKLLQHPLFLRDSSFFHGLDSSFYNPGKEGKDAFFSLLKLDAPGHRLDLEFLPDILTMERDKYIII